MSERNRRALIYLGRSFKEMGCALPWTARTEDDLVEGAKRMLRALHSLNDGKGPVALAGRHTAEGEIVREQIELLLEDSA